MNFLKKWIIFILTSIMLWYAALFFVTPAKADDYNKAVIGHIITETIKGTDIDTMDILEGELANLGHKYALEMVSIIESYLPQILEGIAADIRLKADSKYKCLLLKNGGMNDGCS